MIIYCAAVADRLRQTGFSREEEREMNVFAYTDSAAVKMIREDAAKLADVKEDTETDENTLEKFVCWLAGMNFTGGSEYVDGQCHVKGELMRIYHGR
jgi:hypothetical protein